MPSLLDSIPIEKMLRSSVLAVICVILLAFIWASFEFVGKKALEKQEASAQRVEATYDQSVKNGDSLDDIKKDLKGYFDESIKLAEKQLRTAVADCQNQARNDTQRQSCSQ